MSRILPRLERYHRPARVDDAIVLLQEHGRSGMLLGGGVSLGMVPRPHVCDIVSIELLGLDTVRREDSAIVIGAAMTLGRLERTLDTTSPAERLLRATILRTATTPLRNLMTVGGVIGGVGPWSDLPVSLLALGADLVLDGSDVRSLERYLSDAHRAPAVSLITEVRVTTSGCRGAAFIKLGRNETDLALASAAVVLCDREMHPPVRVAIGGLVPRPLRLPTLERHLGGASHDRDSIIRLLREAVSPRPDPRADADYRLMLAGTCVLDCFDLAREEEACRCA